MRKFSPSALNSYFTCPNQWKLINVVKAPMLPVDTSHEDLGKLIHSNIAKYYRIISANPTEGEVRGTISSIFEENYNASLSHLKQRYGKCRDNFANFEVERLKTWKSFKPLFVEELSETEVFVCITDAYWNVDGVGVDFKTGYGGVEVTKEDMRQGLVNRLVLEANGHKVKKFLFVYLAEGRILEVPQVSGGWVLDEARNMKDMIDVGRYPKNKGGLCGFCSTMLSCEFEEENLWNREIW